MQSRGRFAGVAVGALLAAVALGGCSLIGLGDEEPLTCQGEAPPSSAPGDSQVLMTVGQGETSWDITTVVYADGSVALIDDGADSAAGAGPTWHTGYLLPCALDEARSLAEEALFGAPDFGEVVLADGSWTWVHYDNGALSALAKVYGFESGYTEGLDWSQRRAREDLEALTDFLSVNIVSTGERLPIGAVQVDTGAEAPAAEVGDEASAGKDSGDGGSEDDSEDGSGAKVEVPEVADWPGPPLGDLLGQQGCGVLKKKQAQAVYEFVTGPGLGEADGALNVRVLPPGVAGCA